MSHMPRSFKGVRVRYQKYLMNGIPDNRPSRTGLTGTVIEDECGNTFSKITVEFDNGVVQDYLRGALCTDGRVGSDSYLYPIDEDKKMVEENRKFVVAGKNGGRLIPCHDYEEAANVAAKMAVESKSGQPYVIYKAYEEFQRAQPPITVKKVED